MDNLFENLLDFQKDFKIPQIGPPIVKLPQEKTTL